MVAITGTNGKTTVTGLCGHVLSARYNDVRVTGNIGAPLIKAVPGSTPETVFVTEVSSYQLETCGTLRPHIASVLNIQPDHLERHGTLEAYAAAKRRLIEKQEPDDFALLNGDDPFVSGMASHTGAKVMMISASTESATGGFLRGDELVCRTESGEFVVGRRPDMLLKGEHNALNALHAGLAGLLMGVQAEQVRERIHSFEGYKHRMEKIAVRGGVTYINDSKATNVEAALAAIKTFLPGPMILILGGDDKGLDYSNLYEEIVRHVKRVIVLGPGLRGMAHELKSSGYGAVDTADDMEGAVRKAAAQAAPGDIVLLSPASSSFDIFKNFEERGERFEDAVKSL